jgi:hypothetical protein
VTAYHLLDKILAAGADADTLTYEIHFSPISTVTAKAVLLQGSPAADFMVLSVSGVGGQNIKVLSRADRNTAKIVEGRTPIYSAGYPEGIGFSVTPGVITSFDGADGVIGWTTNLSFKEGQSGSPIILDDGRVIAIAKGVDSAAATIGFVVPSRLIPAEYWDTPTAGAPTPSDVASASRVVVEQVLDKPHPEPRMVTVEFELPHCSDPAVKTSVIAPRPGWRIDPASVAPPTQVASRGDNLPVRVDEATVSKITVSSKLANFGKCVSAFGQTLESDIPAYLQAQIKFTEVPDPASTQWATVSNTSLAQLVKAPLPAAAPSKLRFSLVSPDGQKTEFTPQNSEIVKGALSSSLDLGKVAARLTQF